MSSAQEQNLYGKEHVRRYRETDGESGTSGKRARRSSS
jgi:hypothetical protein